jgi:predicted acyltransferase
MSIIAAESPPKHTDTTPAAVRLKSIDAFRGIVIFAMLVVNNIGDPRHVGYFWKHADWKPVSLWSDLTDWWRGASSSGLKSLTEFPLFHHCTLADGVMPMFMLIIGIAIPFAASAARRRGDLGVKYWSRVVRRGLTLYALGWCIGLSVQFLSWRFNTSGDRPLRLLLGMDVLQLLGVSFIVARVAYALPIRLRLATAAGLFIFHWALLRFYPQGSYPAGTFTEAHNAIGYIYQTWRLFHAVQISSWLSFSIVGMMSVPPAVATMLLGTALGDVLAKREIKPALKIRTLFLGGFIVAVAGILWSFDLPMNKPRWTPGYLLYCSGVGSIGIAFLYWLIDVRRVTLFSFPFVVLGTNAIGVYFLSIMAKIWLLDMPRMRASDGTSEFFAAWFVHLLQRWTTASVGSWMFTGLFVMIVWSAAMQAYRRNVIWKV